MAGRISEADREAALNTWIRYFQAPNLQQATARFDVPSKLRQIEKEVFEKSSNLKQYEQNWRRRVYSILQRLQSSTGVQQQQQQQQQQAQQQQQQPTPVPHAAHMYHASPYGQLPGQMQGHSGVHQMYPYGNPQDAGGHGPMGTHAYPQHGVMRVHGPMGQAMPTPGDHPGGYYHSPGIMQPVEPRGSLSDMHAQQGHMGQATHRMAEGPYATAHMQSHNPSDPSQSYSAAGGMYGHSRMATPGMEGPYPGAPTHPHHQAASQYGQAYPMQQPGAPQMTTAGPERRSYGGGPRSDTQQGGSASGRTSGHGHTLPPGYPVQGSSPGQAGMGGPASHTGMHAAMDMSGQMGAPHPGIGGASQGGGAGMPAGGEAMRSLSGAFPEGLDFDPTPIDQIGRDDQDDDFSDIAGLLGGEAPVQPEPLPSDMADPYAVSAPPPSQPAQGQNMSPRYHRGAHHNAYAAPGSAPGGIPAGMQQPQQQQHMTTRSSAAGQQRSASGALGPGQAPGSRQAWVTDPQQQQAPGSQAAQRQAQHAQHTQAQAQAAAQQKQQQNQSMMQQQQQQQQPVYMHVQPQHQVQQSDGAQVGKKQPRGPSMTGQEQQQQPKQARLQHAVGGQAPGVAPNAAPQAAASPAGAPQSDNQRNMKVAQDAHKEVRKATEQAKLAWQLLTLVKGGTPPKSSSGEPPSLPREAIERLRSSHWPDRVQKAITDYQKLEKSFHHAVKVLKARSTDASGNMQNDKNAKDAAIVSLGRMVTVGQQLCNSFQQLIRFAEEARARTSGGTPPVSTPRNSNSLAGTGHPPGTSYDGGAPGAASGAASAHGQQVAAAHTAQVGVVPGGGGPGSKTASPPIGGMPTAVLASDPAPGSHADRPQPSPAAAPPTQPKPRIRIRARPSSAAASAVAAGGAMPSASRPPQAPTSTLPSTAAQPSGGAPQLAAPSPRTATPPMATPPMGTPPAASPPAMPSGGGMSMAKSESGSMVKSEAGPGLQHAQPAGGMHAAQVHAGPGGMHAAAYGGLPQGPASPETAPSDISGTVATGMLDGSRAPPGGHSYSQAPTSMPLGYSTSPPGPGVNMPKPLGMHVAPGAAHGGPGATTAAAAAAPQPSVVPPLRQKRQPASDWDLVPNSLSRLSAVPDSNQKAMLSTSLNPVTHPVPPTSGIQSNSFDSDSTEVASGPLRTPAPATLSVCDLELSGSDRYSTFCRTVDPCTPMVYLPGKAPFAASDLSARPAPQPLTLTLPECEAAERLRGLCAALSAEYKVSLTPGKLNPMFTGQEAYVVEVRPDGGSGTAACSWCALDVMLDEASWDSGQEAVVMTWPQVSQGRGQGVGDLEEVAGREMRSLMDGMLAGLQRLPSLRDVIAGWRKVHDHVVQKMHSAPVAMRAGTACVL